VNFSSKHFFVFKESDREIQRLSVDIRKHAMDNNKDALRTLAKAVVK
jgi:hypothetical protein